jgi:hypothetical protein
MLNHLLVSFLTGSLIAASEDDNDDDDTVLILGDIDIVCVSSDCHLAVIL